MNRYIYLVLSILLFTNCGKKMKAIDLSQATIRVDSCGIYYKNNRLELGQSIAEWEKVLGKPSRDTNLGKVWDNLGIAVDDWQNGDSTVFGIYIFFLNLDSREGQEGKLTMARDFESVEHVVARNLDDNGNSLISDDVKRMVEQDNKEKIKSYPYPYHTYQGYVDLNGCPIGFGMKVEEINAYRQEKKIPDSSLFAYIDEQVDGINQSDITNKTMGGKYRTSATTCRDGRLMGCVLMYGYEETLEYLHLERESEDWYIIRKEIENEDSAKQ